MTVLGSEECVLCFIIDVLYYFLHDSLFPHLFAHLPLESSGARPPPSCPPPQLSHAPLWSSAWLGKECGIKSIDENRTKYTCPHSQTDSFTHTHRQRHFLALWKNRDKVNEIHRHTRSIGKAKARIPPTQHNRYTSLKHVTFS